MWMRLLAEGVGWVGACEAIEYFAVRKEEGNVYPLKLPWRLAYWALLACFFELLRGMASGDPSLDAGHLAVLALISGAIILFLRPRSIIAGETGVSSCGVFGLIRRFIPWADVQEVSYDWEEPPDRLRVLFWVAGARISVSSRSGDRIKHTIWNSGQASFLNDLRAHVQRAAFDLGVYEMNSN